MKKVDPKLLLDTNWDKVTIKGNKNTKVMANRLGYEGKYSKTIVDLYDHFRKTGINKYEALIMALLIKYDVTHIRPKGKTLSFQLNDSHVVKVKLTSNDIINNSEEIIKAVISNYVKSRNFKLKEMLKDNRDVIINFNSRDTGIKLNNNVYYLHMFNEEKFGLNDQKLLLDVFAEMLSDFGSEVELIKNSTMVKIGSLNNNNSMLYSDFPNEQTYVEVIIDIIIKLGDKSVDIINPSDALYNEVKEFVDSHNEKVRNLNVGKPIIKKNGEA